MLYPGWANDTDSVMMDPRKRMSRASTWSLNTLDSVDSYYAGAGEEKEVDMQGRLADAIWKLSSTASSQ